MGVAMGITLLGMFNPHPCLEDVIVNVKKTEAHFQKASSYHKISVTLVSLYSPLKYVCSVWWGFI